MHWVVQVHAKAAERATPAYCMNQTDMWTLPETAAFWSNLRQEI